MVLESIPFAWASSQELLLGGVPPQLAAEVHRDIAQQTGRAGTVRDLDRRDRLRCAT